jgi:hypothetical protein
MLKALLPFALFASVPAHAGPVVVEAAPIVVRTSPIDQSTRFAPDAVVSAYSNLAGFNGAILTNGGVATDGVNTRTLFVADDIVPLPEYASADLVSVKIAVGNYNPVPVTVRLNAMLFDPDGPAGGPGTHVMSIIFSSLILDPLVVTVLSAMVPPGLFPMPDGPFWAGVSFDDDEGTAMVTPGQLANLGVAYFDPPQVGSSENRLFITATPFTMSGTILERTDSPAYNFGWEFNVDDSTPVQVSSWGRLKTLYR